MTNEARFRALMLISSATPKGETIRYVAHCGGRWLALAMFSASALLCAARDDWIGWERGTSSAAFTLSPTIRASWFCPAGCRTSAHGCCRCARGAWCGTAAPLRPRGPAPGDIRGPCASPGNGLPRNWLCVGHTRGFGRHTSPTTGPSLSFSIHCAGMRAAG